MSKAKGAGFIARNWLENDGDGAEQWQAAGRWEAGQVVHVSGKRALAAFEGCRKDEIVVSSTPVPAAVNWGCTYYDPAKLKETGSIAYRHEKGGWQKTTARDLAGDRLWTNWPKPKVSKNQYVRINPTKTP